MDNRTWKVLQLRIVVIVCIVALLIPVTSVAGSPGQGKVEPESATIVAVPYDAIPYSEIPAKLHEIEANSDRVRVEVIGQSAGGRDLFLVTLSDPDAMGRLGKYQAIRHMMLEDPEKAQDMIEKFGDFKVPFFVNASIHGTEYPGVDAAIKLIETLAYEDSEEVQAILDSVILLVNVVANPDGRVLNTRTNANGFDLNRDFITQSQPETRAMVRVIADWNPMVLLDLHGFYNPMLIEPCSPPHNPNYEYDLYIKWALANALAMEAELYDQLGFEAQIPYLEWDLGWEDWAPSYTPMYAMYHGAYGHTLETSYHDERGVYADYATMWGSLQFVAENKEAMLYDQIEIFRRGYLDLLQQPIPPELLPEYPQYEDLMIQDFPAAYVIPVGPPFQMSQHQAARLVEFLLFNDVQVHQATQPFVMDGVEYPRGTYVVWMNQPKRGMANTILEDGLDLSDIPDLYFYSPPTVWSNARLWGADLAVMEDRIEIETTEIKAAEPPQGSVVVGGEAGAYAYAPTSIAAIQATNALLADGFTLYRVETPFEDSGRTFDAGTFILPADLGLANELAQAYGLEVAALQGIPSTAITMRQQQIAALIDIEGYDLLERFGFEFDAFTVQDLNAGPDLTGYDVFVNDTVSLSYEGLSSKGRKALEAFFTAGGDYVGLGRGGSDVATQLGFMSFSEYNPPGNSIARIDVTAGDPISAGFGAEGYVFVNSAVIFEPGVGVEIAASLAQGEFLVSGYWPGWQDSEAGGKAVAIHKTVGDQDMTLIGFDAVFRAHPENGFRMVANAIYNGLE